MKRKLLFLLVLLSCVACKKKMSDYPLSNMREIATFEVKYYHNVKANIVITHTGTINQTERTIEIHLPVDADLKHICPFMNVSPKTIVTPASLEEVDFSNGPVEYVVTAESGKKAYYIATAYTDFIYEDASMLRLYLMNIPADTTHTIDPEEPTSGFSARPESYLDGAKIQALLPHGSGYDLSGQATYLDMTASSHGCTVEVSEAGDESDYRPFVNKDVVDYTSGNVIFKVTSQSGKVVRYHAEVREKIEEG